MKKTFTFLLIFILAFNFTGLAQTGIFMQITGALGESQSQFHRDWIDIEAFQAGGCATVTFTGGPGGPQPSNATTNDFTFTTNVEKTTTFFKSKMYTGTSITSVLVDFERLTGGNTSLIYYKIQMENAFVTSVTEAGTNADGKPVCNITLSPSKFKYTYRPININGTLGTAIIFGWDRLTNTTW